MEQVSKRQGGFTLVELLIVIGIIAVLAAIIVPNVLGSRDKVNKLTDRSNLQKVYSMCTSYSDGRGKGRFPLVSGSPKPAFKSLQIAVRNEGSAFDPEWLISPVGNHVEAPLGDEGYFVLSADNNSYAYIGEITRNDQNRILASNMTQDVGQGQGYKDGVTIIRTNGAADFLFTNTDEYDREVGNKMFPKNLVDNEGQGPSEKIMQEKTN